MATFDERAVAIANALINGTAAAPLRNRLGLALARSQGRDGEYTAANASGKSQIAVECIRAVLIGIVRSTEGSDAAGVAEATVDADFSPVAPKPLGAGLR